MKQAIKLIEKSSHPNAAVRLIQRSKGRKQRSRKRSRGRCTKLEKRVKDLERKLKQRSRKLCRGRSTKLAKRVKDLERKLKTKTIELAKMQVAAKTFKKKKKSSTRKDFIQIVAFVLKSYYVVVFTMWTSVGYLPEPTICCQPLETACTN